jgi:GR25 family glycosyltransferase involved in LPS biosynthesis
MIKCNYVINLERRKDKWDSFENDKNKTVLKNEKFIRFRAFDGYDFENEIKRFNLEDNIILRFMKKERMSVAKGVLGCLLSHLTLLDEIINNTEISDDDFVGIYEDDIVYCPDFDQKYEEFKKINLNELDIEFLYLGGRFSANFDCRNANDFNKLFDKTSNTNIVKRKNMIYRNFNWDRCTFSFIIKKNICKKLKNIISTSFVKKEGGRIRFEAIDFVYTCAFDKIKMFDYLPHLYYSILNFNSDIQGNNLQKIIQF